MAFYLYASVGRYCGDPQSPQNDMSEESDSEVFERWTIGRVDEFAKTCIYAVGALFMFTKAIAKLPLAFVVSADHPFSFQGIAKDLAIAAIDVDKMVSAALKTIFAPRSSDYENKENSSFKTLKKVFVGQIIKGKHHRPTLLSAKDFFNNHFFPSENTQKVVARDSYMDIILNNSQQKNPLPAKKDRADIEKLFTPGSNQ